MALMMSVKTIISTSVAIIATGAMFACVAPFASADSAQTSAVVSSRSFPKASSVKKNLFAESTSTSVDENSKWGGIETLDVPQTESQGGEGSSAAAAAAQKAADEAAAAQSAAAAAASRSEQRASIPQVDLGKMTGTGTGAELASFSLKFQGLSVCCRRQHSGRMGLLRFCAVRLLPVWHLPASYLWCSSHRGYSGRKLGGCQAG